MGASKRLDTRSFDADWSEMPGIPLADLARLRDEMRSEAVEQPEVPVQIAVFRGDLATCVSMIRARDVEPTNIPPYRGLRAVRFGDSWVVVFGHFLLVGKPVSVRLLLGLGTPTGDIQVPQYEFEQRLWLTSRGVVFQGDEKGASDG